MKFSLIELLGNTVLTRFVLLISKRLQLKPLHILLIFFFPLFMWIFVKLTPL